MNRYATIVTGWIGLMVVVGCQLALAGEKDQDFLAIATGNAKTTAYQIGMDLKALVKPYNIHLSVCPSNGSVENIYAVYQRPGHHLGLVQSDVMAFVAKLDKDPLMTRINKQVKWVYPLYQQEVHLLARRGIDTLNDLNGKRVGIGPVESGGYLTGRLLFEITGVHPQGLAAIDDAKALAAIKAGDLDAMVIVDGSPVWRLMTDVSASDHLHLVPVVHEAIRSFYPAAHIPGGTYAWQKDDVATISVGVILVAYDFHDYRCDTIGRLAYLMRGNLAWLRANGHPKWKTVRLGENVPGWAPYACVTDYVPPLDLQPSVGMDDNRANPVAEAIRTIFRP
ncbi:TAXI family TRAP transporter solute-binding subunit [Desulfosarcina cetonica]